MPGHAPPILSARAAHLVACLHCGSVWRPDKSACSLCGSPLHSRFPDGRQRVWAWWLAGLLAYIPANLYPMMITDTIAADYSSTIIGGVIELLHHGSYFVGGVVFLASVIVPISKFMAIAYLMLATRRPNRTGGHRLHRVYEIVEYIGRWSMIDVFVVAILSALVHLGTVADIYPGIAAVSFAASVICTMISALSLDPRLIWDATENQNP